MKKLFFIFNFSFLISLVLSPAIADGPLVGTAGSNLTAFNSGMGAVNNNTWNQMINSRPMPSADFGNCNALILRCAQPKCATGGCVSMDIAYPIVAGCVMSNDACKSHGDQLIQTISAQIVANTTAKANDAAQAAQVSAAQAAAAQSSEQLQQMQYQMQQMQSQMQQQSQATADAVQRALDEQRELAAAQAATAAAAQTAAASQPTKIETAAASGVSADILAREKASGQIMTQLENAEVALKTLKKTMQNAFDYAGCDANGNNCTGPRRVKAFKDKANQFFDPYENVLDEVYDALIMAQSLGVDITDIYMMLNGSCNVWGKYLCGTCSAAETGKLLGDKDKEGEYRCEEQSGNYYYTVAKVLNKADNTWKVAPNQRHCTLTQMLSSRDDVQQNWLDMGAGSSGGIRVECASDAIESSTLFRNRKKQASIDIETLQRMILQDAPNTFKGKANDPQSGDLPAPTGYCSVDDNDIAILNNLTQKRALTSSGLSKVCVSLKSKTGFLDPVMISASESKNDSNTGAEFDSTPYDGKPLCEAQAKLSGGTCKELTGIWYIFGGNSSDRYTTIDNCKRNLAENHECVTAAPGFRQVQTIYSNSCSSYCTSWEQVGDKSKEECLKKCADEEKSKTANTSNTTKPITLTFDMLGQGTEQRISNIKNSDTKTNNPIQNASISFKQTNCISYGGTWLGTHCDCTRVEPGSFIMCTNATR